MLQKMFVVESGSDSHGNVTEVDLEHGHFP